MILKEICRAAKRKRIAANIFVAVLVLFFLIPILHTLGTSVKADKEIYATPVTLIPKDMTGAHYRHVVTEMKDTFFTFFKNSVVTTGASLLLILSLGSLAAFGLARIDFMGRKLIISFISFVLAIPLIITVIPIFMMETALNIKNTNLGLILPYTAVYMPIPLFIMYSSFIKIPKELEESAYIDGASILQVYRCFLPLAKGGLVSGGIIAFIYIWGEFLFSLILNTRETSMTLPIGIMSVNTEQQAWALGPLSAVIVLSIIIPISLYLSVQQYFVKGLMEGSIKG